MGYDYNQKLMYGDAQLKNQLLATWFKKKKSKQEVIKTQLPCWELGQTGYFFDSLTLQGPGHNESNISSTSDSACPD